MALLYLIRHAKTPGNEQKKYIGSTDESLSEAGAAALEELIRRGVYPAAGAVYASPMKRCRETARRIYPGVPVQIVPGFAELNFGPFEGKTYEDLKDDPVYREWIGSGGSMSIPGGGDVGRFKADSLAAFEKTAAEILANGLSCAAAVLHGGTIMAVMERYAPEKRPFYDWQVKNCGGYRLTLDKAAWENSREIRRAEPIDISK